MQCKLARSLREAFDVANDGSVMVERISFGLFMGDVERVEVYLVAIVIVFCREDEGLLPTMICNGEVVNVVVDGD